MEEEQFESKLVPDKNLGLAEFIAKAKNLLDEMGEHYIDSTGDEEPKSFAEWQEELLNAYLND